MSSAGSICHFKDSSFFFQKQQVHFAVSRNHLLCEGILKIFFISRRRLPSHHFPGILYVQGKGEGRSGIEREREIKTETKVVGFICLSFLIIPDEECMTKK